MALRVTFDSKLEKVVEEMAAKQNLDKDEVIRRSIALMKVVSDNVDSGQEVAEAEAIRGGDDGLTMSIKTR